jgi:late competence protein required for DNA uptake (superfamily II DNA/RNA helicase)
MSLPKTDAATRKWADYMRLRRNPTKTCPGCGNAFPNTLEHFAAGVRDRVGLRCHACVEAAPVPTRVKQHCPCCGGFERLVLDRQAPVAVFICRSCLRMVNDRLSVLPDTRERIERYVVWRLQAQQKAAGSSEPAAKCEAT